uniref:Lipoprotein n=1 Tax=uncultured bacterium TB306_p TaxID=1552137 RepID=A0A0K0LBJ5_9BACT|nr:hypothetical protein [uncultured bacterium TB306_p]
MQTNKIIIILTLLALLGCKKTSGSLNSLELDKKTNVHITDSINKNLEKQREFESKSFVISCGSGCAMSYNAVEIVCHENNIEVKFKVEMYVDEALSDTYYETFIFSFTDSNKLIKVNKKGNTEDFLKTQMPAAQETFLNFGESIADYAALPASPTRKNIEVQENTTSLLCHLILNRTIAFVPEMKKSASKDIHLMIFQSSKKY